RPPSQFHQVGQNYGGLVHAQPQPPAPTLLAFVQKTRGSQPKFKIVGSKDQPDLPGVLKTQSQTKNQRGVGLKVTYEMNGHAVEEEFYAVYDLIAIPYDGPQGRTWQINWGLVLPHSFRAPDGTLEKRRAVFATTAKSFRPNPAWPERKKAV